MFKDDGRVTPMSPEEKASVDFSKDVMCPFCNKINVLSRPDFSKQYFCISCGELLEEAVFINKIVTGDKS